MIYVHSQIPTLKHSTFSNSINKIGLWYTAEDELDNLKKNNTFFFFKVTTTGETCVFKFFLFFNLTIASFILVNEFLGYISSEFFYFQVLMESHEWNPKPPVTNLNNLGDKFNLVSMFLSDINSLEGQVMCLRCLALYVRPWVLFQTPSKTTKFPKK